MSRAWRVAAVALAAAAVGTFASASPASAHVTVDPTTAVQGGFARLAFRVPTESDSASTTKVEVFLPENAPVPSVSTMPVAGWTVSVQRRKLGTPIEVHGAPVDEVVSTITWTAAGGGGIRPGQFLEFPVSMGPLPTVDRMVLKTLQTYSDGTIVRWIDEPVASGEEPEHPAPVLALTPARQAQVTASGAPQAAPQAAADGGSGLAVGLAIAALAVGLGGLVLGGLAFVRSRGAGRPSGG
jgi:uncharacterized protein YcnI